MLINWIRIQILTTWRWGGAKYPFPEPRLPGTEDDLSPRLLSTDPARSPRLPATDPARCSRLAIEPFLTPISYPRSEPAENKLNGVFANPSPPPGYWNLSTYSLYMEAGKSLKGNPTPIFSKVWCTCNRVFSGTLWKPSPESGRIHSLLTSGWGMPLHLWRKKILSKYWIDSQTLIFQSHYP